MINYHIKLALILVLFSLKAFSKVDYEQYVYKIQLTDCRESNLMKKVQNGKVQEVITQGYGFKIKGQDYITTSASLITRCRVCDELISDSDLFLKNLVVETLKGKLIKIKYVTIDEENGLAYLHLFPRMNRALFYKRAFRVVKPRYLSKDIQKENKTTNKKKRKGQGISRYTSNHLAYRVKKSNTIETSINTFKRHGSFEDSIYVDTLSNDTIFFPKAKVRIKRLFSKQELDVIDYKKIGDKVSINVEDLDTKKSKLYNKGFEYVSKLDKSPVIKFPFKPHKILFDKKYKGTEFKYIDDAYLYDGFRSSTVDMFVANGSNTNYFGAPLFLATKNKKGHYELSDKVVGITQFSKKKKNKTYALPLIDDHYKTLSKQEGFSPEKLTYSTPEEINSPRKVKKSDLIFKSPIKKALTMIAEQSFQEEARELYMDYFIDKQHNVDPKFDKKSNEWKEKYPFILRYIQSFYDDMKKEKSKPSLHGLDTYIESKKDTTLINNKELKLLKKAYPKYTFAKVNKELGNIESNYNARSYIIILDTIKIVKLNI